MDKLNPPPRFDDVYWDNHPDREVKMDKLEHKGAVVVNNNYETRGQTMIVMPANYWSCYPDCPACFVEARLNDPKLREMMAEVIFRDYNPCDPLGKSSFDIADQILSKIKERLLPNKE